MRVQYTWLKQEPSVCIRLTLINTLYQQQQQQQQSTIDPKFAATTDLHVTTGPLCHLSLCPLCRCPFTSCNCALSVPKIRIGKAEEIRQAGGNPYAYRYVQSLILNGARFQSQTIDFTLFIFIFRIDNWCYCSGRVGGREGRTCVWRAVG